MNRNLRIVIMNSLEDGSPAPQNLIVNGGFDSADGWDLSGVAQITGGKLVGSGSGFDGASQSVAPLSSNTAYTVSATLAVSGGDVVFFVGDTQSDTFSSSGAISFEITTAQDAQGFTIALLNFSGTVDDVSAVVA